MGASTGSHPGVLEVEAARRAIVMVAGLGPERSDASPMSSQMSEWVVLSAVDSDSVRMSVHLSADRVTPPGPYSPSVA